MILCFREESLSQQERVGFSMNRSQEVHMQQDADIEQGKPNNQVSHTNTHMWIFVI